MSFKQISHWPGLVACLAPQPFVLLLPLALFYAVAWPPTARPLPVLGLAAVSLLLAEAMTGWIVPFGNQQFREVTFAALGGHEVLTRGVTELFQPALATAAVHGARGAWRFLLTQAGFSMLCPAMVFLSAALRGLPPANRRWWLFAMPFTFAAGQAVLGLLCLTLLGPAWPKPSLLLFAAVSSAVALELNRRSGSGREAATSNP